jgi:hypothetical protein
VDRDPRGERKSLSVIEGATQAMNLSDLTAAPGPKGASMAKALPVVRPRVAIDRPIDLTGTL